MSNPKSNDRAKQLAENFAELEPPYSNNEAVAEAARCLFCFDAPCTRACPTDIDVPKFIRQILHMNPLGAAETILEANIFGGSCARACPTEVLCEGACVDNTLLNQPVRIGRLQRFACDAASEKKIQFFQAAPDIGKKVAVVGSGPASMTCAHELRKLGAAVTVFEARDMPGGINTYGIARYKYGSEFALTEIERAQAIGGIDLRLNTPIDGRGVAKLLGDYDAVFLGVGLGKTASLGIEGEALDGVWEALDFIFQTHTMPLDQCQCGDNVIVVGGGNTAVDVATAAIRLGAKKVTICYRRTDAEMPAFKYEYDLTLSDGIAWEFSAAPVRFIGDNGQLSGLELVRTASDGAGRGARLKPVQGSEFTLNTDMVIEALGQEPLLDLLGAIPDLKIDRGRVQVNPATGETSVPGLFSGGDCVSKGAEVVDAVQAGKIAAAGIHALIGH